MQSPAAVNHTYLSKLEEAASYPGLEIIAKLPTVLEVEPAELLRVQVPPRSHSSRDLNRGARGWSRSWRDGLYRGRHRQPVRDPDFEFAPSLLYQLGKQMRICGIGGERCPATIFLKHTVGAIDSEPASLCSGCLRYGEVAIIISRDGSDR